MTSFSQSERDRLLHHIRGQTVSTPYACSSLEAIGNGTTNFVFRGTLARRQTYENGGSFNTVIIKKAEDFISINRDFKIDPVRCRKEATMLMWLRILEPHLSPVYPIQVSVPRCLHIEASDVLVLQDFISTSTLTDTLTSLPPAQASLIGHALGSWLKKFHSWTSAPEQNKWSGKFMTTPMQALKWKITYEQGSDVLQRFQELFREEETKVWEEIKASRRKELLSVTLYEEDDGWGVVHGDFWSGNVLVTNPSSAQSLQLHIIDFELSQFSHHSTDLGQFIGDLLEKQHFNVPLAASIETLVDGFVQAYKPISEELAFRTVLYVGVHMMNWWSRGSHPGKSEKGRELLKRAWDVVVKGWNRDMTWFREQGGVLGQLFK